jgi:hypothetical protein
MATAALRLALVMSRHSIEYSRIFTRSEHCQRSFS